MHLRSLIAVLAGVAALALAPGALAAIPAPPSGFTTTWSDDFSGAANTGVSGSNWLYDTGTCYPGCPAGNWGTGEVESMSSSTANVYQDGAGHLVIKAIHSGSNPTSGWTSGRIETQRTDFGAPAGGIVRIQASIQQPNVSGAAAQGYWPAFWMLGSAFRGVYTNWPSIGEVDILEDIDGQSNVYGTLHCGTSPGGPCNETSGIGSGAHGCSGCQTGYHTYAVEIDRSVSPEQIRWYLDGTNYFTVRSNQVDATTWANAVDHGFFVILDLAMGGGWPGNPTSSTASGASMNVDYVAVYTKAASGGGGGGGTGGISATSTIQAESYSAQSGTQTETTTDTGGGQDVGWIANGDWLQYNNVNFGSGGLHNFNLRLASGAAAGVSGTVEIHLDSLSNPAIGSISIANTGGWQSWRSVPGSMSTVTGTHTVYLKFVSGQPADFVNVNWFTFS
jgi:beta-glucanase (GH16 family)